MDKAQALVALEHATARYRQHVADLAERQRLVRREWLAVMRRAERAGASQREIARVIGRSLARVQQLLGGR